MSAPPRPLATILVWSLAAVVLEGGARLGSAGVAEGATRTERPADPAQGEVAGAEPVPDDVVPTPGPPGGVRWISVIVQLEDEPVATYRGGVSGLAATSRLATGARRIDRGSSAVRRYRAHLARRLGGFEGAVKKAIPGARVLHRYDVVVGGVALLVPESRVAVLAALPGVRAVFPDEARSLDSNKTPALIGASHAWGELGGPDDAGEGVIVGVLDSGIWPEHPSFADPDTRGKAYVAPPGSWACDFAGGANPGPAFACNGKILGAHRFLATYDACPYCTHPAEEFSSARDSDGHGTHTASTAAGNRGVRAQLRDVRYGSVSGVAPRAHLIAYKVCGPSESGGCFASDSIAAIQQAILDGVDVINYSIGGGGRPYLDPVELAFRDAYAAGIFVAASAGNDGPVPDTAAHLGGWVTTVAATTSKRAFLSKVALEADDGTKLVLSGASVGRGVKPPAPVVSAAAAGDPRCLDDTPDGAFVGKIVVCRRGGSSRLAKSFNVARRGAFGMLLFNDAADPAQRGLATDTTFVPSVHLEHDAGTALLAFLGSHTGVTASFSPARQRRTRADVVAAFSSRGGSANTLGIAKPDLAAPGVQILAGDTPEHWNPAAVDGELFQALEGTSMASPHVAGAAALLRQMHPDWTPGRIKSALMTSASTRRLVREAGVTPDPFDGGSGRVDLAKAIDPGLTFDVPAPDWVDHEGDLWNVNHPSVYLPVGAPDRVVLLRTPQSELDGDSVWTTSVAAPADLAVAVPPSFTVTGNGSTTFPIVIDKSAIPPGEVRHATLELRHTSHRVVLPITAVGRKPLADLLATSVVVTSPARSGAPITIGTQVRNAGTLAATGFFVNFYVSADATFSFDDTFLAHCDFASGLPAGGTLSCGGTIAFAPLAPVPPGAYHLLVYVDSALEVAESNEGNNVTATAGTFVVE